MKTINDVVDFALKEQIVKPDMHLSTIKNRLTLAIELLEDEAFELLHLEKQVAKAAQELRA